MDCDFGDFDYRGALGVSDENKNFRVPEIWRQSTALIYGVLGRW